MPEMVENRKKSGKIDDPTATTPDLGASRLIKPFDDPEMHLAGNSDSLLQLNLFNLQVSEVIKEFSVSCTMDKKIANYLGALQNMMMKFPVHKQCKLASCNEVFEDVKVPFLMKPKKVKGDMLFLPPSHIEVVGSYRLKTGLKQKLNIDLVLELPKETMQEKDFLNQRYLRKRAVYLSYIAHHVKQLQCVSNTKFAFFMENHQKPILLIFPSGKLAELITIRCHTCPAEGCLKYDRFHPSKCNVRRNWFNGIDIAESHFPPTPHYNSIILCDMLIKFHTEEISKVLAGNNEIRNSIKLLKIWLHQRDLDQGQGCFSGFLMSMLVVYLERRKIISKTMTSYHVIHSVLQFLATSDWVSSGITMNDSDSLTEFHKHFGVVFVDTTGHHNLCFDLLTPVYKQVQHEARVSMKIWNDPNIWNSFKIIFLSPVPYTKSFDSFLRISKPSSLHKSCMMLNIQDDLADYNGNAISCAFPSLTMCLQRGLKSRVKLISCRGCKYGSWDVSRRAPQWKSPRSLPTFGFLMNSEMQHIVDKGPDAGTPAASTFREFWGDKSDLRRFKDGAICEAVVWDCESNAQRRKLPEIISKYLLNLHCGLSSSCLIYVGSQIEECLQLLTHRGEIPKCYSAGHDIGLEFEKSYKELCSQLCGLKTLPLSVESIRGISAASRNTEVYTNHRAIVNKSQHYQSSVNGIKFASSGGAPTSSSSVVPCEMICYLGGSGKWPQDMDALRRVKAAFHIMFAEEVEKSFKKVVCVPSQTFFDVFKDGFVFRVTITYPGELAVVKTFSSSDGLMNSMLSVTFEERTIHMPKLANALNSISCQNKNFGLTCKLAKHWISAHMLSNHMPELSTELLCAYLFTNPHPYSEPNSPFTAFHRFLCLLSTYDFAANPIIVNFNNLLQEKEIRVIFDYFKENRDTLPALYIATAADETKSTTTRNEPSPVILRRLKALASASVKKLNNIMQENIETINFLPIFKASLSAYDVIINLDTHALGTRGLPVGLDPVQCYLEELQCCYSQVALFFLNQIGGKSIGVIWKPWAFADRDFKVNECSHHSIISSHRIGRNAQAVIEDFMLLGNGIVSTIELRSEKWNLQ